MIGTAVLATIAASQITYVGPQIADAKFEQAFDAALSTCGLRPDAVPRHYATVRQQPVTPHQRAAQEAEVADIARRSGFHGSEAEHPVSYQVIRSFLQTRTFMRLKMEAIPAQQECTTNWLRAQDFTPIEHNQVLPPELRE